jgi:iron complex outermembrane receptor protein
VISGPGGTLWGANAVNGVINVISREAHETKGGLLRGAAGDRQQYLAARYGGALGADGAFRVYAMGFNREDTWAPGGLDEGLDGVQGGFRTDWSGDRDGYTVQGDVYAYDFFARSAGADDGGELHGGNLIARWTRSLGSNSDLRLQAYYDKVQRETPRIFSSVDTYDVETQLHWRLGRHDLLSGAGFRATKDEFLNDLDQFRTDPEQRWISLAHVFVQDQIELRPDLHLIAGLKLEHSSYTGAELLPSLRIAWRPSESATLWAAASRAIRTPSRIERDLAIPEVLVNGTFQNEELIAFEAGYRGSLGPRASLSVSAFYNLYDDLRTTEVGAGADPRFFVGNGLNGRTWGVEAWGAYDVTSWWRLSAGVATLHKDFDLDPDSVDITQMQAAGNDPSYQLLLRSQMEINDRLTVDLRLRAVDDLPDPPVPAYIEADANIAFRITEDVELSVTGRNLFDEHHPETGPLIGRREARRSIYAGLRWTF